MLSVLLLSIPSISIVVALAILLGSQSNNSSKWALEAPVQKEHIAGLVLARGGSEGVPKKNLAIVSGKTLLRRSLDMIHAANRFDSVWVSTDSDEIADETIRAGAKIHRRSQHSATSEAPSIVAVQEFLGHHKDVTIVALVQCTSPFLKAEWLVEAYDQITNDNYDSVFSVTRDHKLRWRVSPGAELSAVNFEVGSRPRRQDWAGEFVETGMFYFTRRHILQENRLQGGRIGFVEVPLNRSLEIDTPLDLEMARVIAALI